MTVLEISDRTVLW